MPMEFYQGRPLEPEELEAIRQQIEQFDTIEAIDPEMRGSSSATGRTWWPSCRQRMTTARMDQYDAPETWKARIKEAAN
jgi:hypothetical protein